MRIVRLIVVCIVAAMLTLGSTVALAAGGSGSPGDKPNGRRIGVAPIITKQVVSEILPNGTERIVHYGRDLDGFKAEPDIETLSTKGYRTVTYKITTYGLFGPLYAMYSKLSWRWDGYKCYLVSRSGWGVAYASGWSYFGLIENSWSGTGTNYITSKYRGKFRYASGWFYYTMYSGIEVQGWNGGSSRCFSY